MIPEPRFLSNDNAVDIYSFFNEELRFLRKELHSKNNMIKHLLLSRASKHDEQFSFILENKLTITTNFYGKLR